MKRTTKDRLEYWGFYACLVMIGISIYMTYVTTH